MHIEDTIRVEVPVDDAWGLLLDLERLAPCLPGAQLQEVEGDEYRGVVKVKVGPITAQYRGAARFRTVDPQSHVAVVEASGRDTRGQGNAQALITVTLTADGAATAVHIDTELSITGKVAQFGRGVLADVSTKLLAQFVANLERDVLGAPPKLPNSPTVESAPARKSRPSEASRFEPSRVEPSSEENSEPFDPPSTPRLAQSDVPPIDASASGVRTIDAADVEPVDLMAVGGGALAGRAVPLIAGVIVVVLLLRRRARRRR